GASLLPLAAAFIPGVGLGAGIAMELGLSPIIGAASNAYFQRRAETNLIHDLTRDISTNFRSGGPRGVGFSYGESSSMMREIRSLAASSASYSNQDILQVFQEGVGAGVFNFNADRDSTMTKL